MKLLDAIFKRWKRPEKTEVAPPQRTGARSFGGDAASAVKAMTPETMLSLIANAERGDIKAQSEMFEHMEESDGDLSGLLLQRKNGVLSNDYQIVPGDDSAQAERAAEFVRAIVKGIPRYRDKLQDLTDAIGKGFSCLEVMWETSAKQWAPVDLKFKPQRWWKLDETDHETLLLIDTDNYSGVEVNPLNFLQHVHHALSGSLSRAGILLTCARPYIVRNYAIKDWLALVEVFGQPLRIGKLRQGASVAEQDLLEAALASLGHDAYGVIPEGTEIEFPSPGSLSISADMYARLGEVALHSMQMAVLGQTLTSGGEQGGSYALGQVHERVRYDLVDSDCQRLDETLSAWYETIVRLNFGPETAAPTHETQLTRPADLKTDSEVLGNLQQAGLRIPRAWAYSHFGIPEPDDGEPVLEAPAPPALAPNVDASPSIRSTQSTRSAVHANVDAPAGLDAGELGRSRIDQLDALGDAGLAAMAPWSRALRADLADYARDAGSLQAAADGLQAFLKGRSTATATAFEAWLAPGLSMGLLAGIADAQESSGRGVPPLDGNLSPNDATAAWPRLGRSTRPRAGSEGVRAADGHTRYPLYTGSESGPALVANALGFDVHPEEAIRWARARRVVDPATFADLDAAAKARSFSVANLTDQYSLDAVQKSLMDSLENGQTLNAWLDNLGDVVARAGLSDVADLGAHHLRLIWRQNTYLAYGAGRFTQMKQVAAERPWWQYIAQLDEGTRPSHRALHLVVKRHDDAFWNSYYPPWGYGCRCLVVSVDADEMAAEGLSPTSDAEVSARYQQLAPGAGGMPRPPKGFGGNPLQAFLLDIDTGAPGTPDAFDLYRRLTGAE